jgi:hypothetical protein
MRVTMMLADGAHAAGGKLYVLGGGWSVMGPGPTAMALALRFEVAWDETDVDHEWSLVLIDADGRPVMCAEHGTHPIQRRGRFHAHRAADSQAGVPIDFVTAVDVGVVSVPPGGRYVWTLTVDRATRDDWQLAFTSRPARNPN